MQRKLYLGAGCEFDMMRPGPGGRPGRRRGLLQPGDGTPLSLPDGDGGDSVWPLGNPGLLLSRGLEESGLQKTHHRHQSQADAVFG